MTRPPRIVVRGVWLISGLTLVCTRHQPSQAICKVFAFCGVRRATFKIENKRSSAKASAGAMSPFDLQDVNMFFLMGKCYKGY